LVRIFSLPLELDDRAVPLHPPFPFSFGDFSPPRAGAAVRDLSFFDNGRFHRSRDISSFSFDMLLSLARSRPPPKSVRKD